MDCIVSGCIVISGDCSYVEIGDNSVLDNIDIKVQDGQFIKIGKNNFFESGVILRTDDEIDVFDMKSKKIINAAASINIDDKVFIGKNSYISKGVSIPTGCLVSQDSFVNKSFKEFFCMISGKPAEIIGSQIEWSVDV